MWMSKLTELIISYCKSGNVTAARNMFDRMPDRNVVSWTAIISGYVKNGYAEEALEVFTLMVRSNVKPNQFTYGSVLRACSVIGCTRSAMQVHACVVKSSFADDLYVQSAFADFYFKWGSVENGVSLFKKMEHRDVVSWNLAIGGNAIRGFPDTALKLFVSMMRDGIQPDHFTFGSVLRACGLIKAFPNVLQIHGFIHKFGFGLNKIVARSLIDAYAKSNCMNSARLLYDAVLQPDLISCTALITGYSMQKQYNNKALELFFDIKDKGVEFDAVILCSMLNICANIPCLSFGKQIHACMTKNQNNCDVVLGNALIDMYAKCGEIEDAHRAFREMKKKNVISWSSLIAGYGNYGSGEAAISLFLQMQDKGPEPNNVTFLSLLSACGHAGLTRKGLEIFTCMVSKYRMNPRAEHYSCIVDLLARGGRVDEAYEFVKNVRVKLNSSHWGALLGACIVYRKKSLAEVLASYRLNCENNTSSANYVLLANVYAAAGLWENAWNARKLLEERELKKNAGTSCILSDMKIPNDAAL